MPAPPKPAPPEPTPPEPTQTRPTPRRILSIWFPRLAAERALRCGGAGAGPLAVVGELRGALVLDSLSAEAEAAGLRRGMALGDARAIRPDLTTRPADRFRESAFLVALARWAGRFSPWVATEPPESLVLDVTGCAHLFGGEAELVAAIEAAAGDLGLSLGLGLADTLGAAWALARYAEASVGPRHAGDAIDQEARATRSRAQKRRWERGGQPPPPASLPAGSADSRRRIAPPGETLAHVAPLPIAALRLDAAEAAALHGLGLTRVGDLAGLPRAQLARRVGPGVAQRLDQAFGRAAEPVAPAPPAPVFSTRLTLPEPIGRTADVLAGVDRLLDALCARLRAAGRGGRRFRLTLVRVDRGALEIEARLARAVDAPAPIRSLLALRLDGMDAGFGFDALRLEALDPEPMAARQRSLGALPENTEGPGQVGGPGQVRGPGQVGGTADLLGRLGARLGVEAVTRLHPAESHIPEKSAILVGALFAPAAGRWPAAPAPRPATIVSPERIRPEDSATPPQRFVWRRRTRRRVFAAGPERIAPEWWLDDPAWRSGPRDYWRVETETGERLWLFEARGPEGGGWFVQGVFA